MNSYANTFYVAHNKDRDVIVIGLRQEYPVFNAKAEDGSPKIITAEDDVANIVIRSNIAKALATAIQEMLEESDQPES